MPMTTKPKPKGKRREKKPQQEAHKVEIPKVNKAPARSNTQKNMHYNILSRQGIELNSETARNAIILSEIIGPPAAKRRRRG